ncbi:MAG TPA: glycosyltransferase [Nitrospirales bacterium]|nr:glycosyltransferase [Nitrospirales bacterium]
MRPPRLVQIVYALSPGGSELLATRLASRLNRDGRYAAAVYAVAHGGTLEPTLAAEGLAYRAFGRTSAIDLPAFRRLLSALKAARPAIVHTHHLGQLLYGGLAARLAGARVVHTEHEFYTLAAPRHRRLLRALSSIADVITAVAPPVASFLAREVGIPREKLKTISNGVEVDLYRTAKPVDREIWGWSRNEQVLACIGRLSREKGQRVLLEAFRAVSRRRPDARLLLVGDGPDREALTALASEWGLDGTVYFAGARVDVPNVLAASDIVVLPSHHEGLPLVALEAMAAARPVVATAVGALPALLNNGAHGRLAPAGNPTALAEAIGGLLDDRPEQARLGAIGHDLVAREYNFEATLRQYARVYDGVVARAGRRR